VALSPEEKAFIDSIEKKIKKYDIEITIDDCINIMNGIQAYTIYNDDSTELVDTAIEIYLIKNSFSYFINKYARVDIPGLGTIQMQPYYFQSEMAKEIDKHRKVVLDKTRQCLTEENYVMTDKGYISIKDVKPGDMIETIIDDKKEFVLVENFIPQGKKEVCRILTNSGSDLKLTLDHKILTKEGWKEAKDLTLKDEIISIINYNDFGNFELEDDKHAALIGYYLADGRASQPSFINTNLDYINEVLEIGKTFDNCEPYIYERPYDENRKQGYDVRLVSNTKNKHIERPLMNFMKEHNINKKSNDRTLTNNLMNLNKKQMSIMLNRLFAGDGYITYNQDKRRPNYIQYEIGLGAPNFTLLKQLEYILQTKYGIHCWIQEQFDKRFTQRFWKIKMTQKKSIIKFIDEIGIKGKTDEVSDLISNEKPYNSSQSFNKIRKIEHLKNKEEVYDITTSSSDFLSNGLMVHNCGMSTVFALYAFWKAHYFEAESVDVVSTKQLKAQAFVKKINTTMASLPEWMKTPVKSQNQQKIVFQHASGATSEIVSESQSENAGRGDSLSVLIMDEVAFYQSEKMIRSIVASAQPTLNKTGGQMIIISTPNGTSGKGAYYYEQVMSARVGEKNTKYLEIDWWEIPDDPRIQGPKKGYNDMLEQAIQAGYYYNSAVKKRFKEFFDPIARDQYQDNDWLNSSYKDLGAPTYRQEILHDFIIAGDKVFNEDILEKVEQAIKDPIRRDKFGTEQVEGWWVWKDPVPGHRYILGIDVGTGTGSDYSSIEVIDVADYEQVAEYKGFVSTPNFVRFIRKVAKWYNEGYIVIESNSIGESIFNGLYYNENEPYNNMFKQMKKKNNVSRYTGWITDVKTRKLIVNDFIDWITVDELWDTIKIYSRRLWLEMTTWVWTGGSKAEHAQGCHDDSIMAFAIAMYNRNKAIISGESFLIGDDGNTISIDDNTDDINITKTDDSFNIVSGEDEEIEEFFQENYSMGKKEYEWLLK